MMSSFYKNCFFLIYLFIFSGCTVIQSFESNKIDSVKIGQKRDWVIKKLGPPLVTNTFAKGSKDRYSVKHLEELEGRFGPKLKLALKNLGLDVMTLFLHELLIFQGQAIFGALDSLIMKKSFCIHYDNNRQVIMIEKLGNSNSMDFCK